MPTQVFLARFVTGLSEAPKLAWGATGEGMLYTLGAEVMRTLTAKASSERQPARTDMRGVAGRVCGGDQEIREVESQVLDSVGQGSRGVVNWNSQGRRGVK